MCFFFKQKTANEVRISDWSSDVCSSDLPVDRAAAGRAGGGDRRPPRPADEIDRGRARLVADEGARGVHVLQRLRGIGDGPARPITAILGVPRPAVATDPERPDVATALRKIGEPPRPDERRVGETGVRPGNYRGS